jgi:hypothetical protein
VAKKVSAKLKVIAKGQQKGQPPNAKKLAKAETKFADGCTKAKSKNDCHVQTSSCAALEATADAAIDVLSGGTTPPTTSSTTPPSTTTSTTVMTTSSTTTTTTSTTIPTDLNGTFASHVTTTGTVSVPLIGVKAANIDIVLRIFNSTSGSTVTSHLEFCRVNTATTDVSLVVNIPTSITALLVNDQTSPVQNLTVGGPVSLPSFNITVGQDAAGNSADTDHDGNPGVSIPTQLQGSNETMFSSLVIGLSFPSATLTDANTISGQLTVTTTGKVFGGTPLNLTGNLSVVTGTPTVAFTSTRLTGNVPCSQVLTMF